MALRKTKGPAEAEWLFGWDPYAYVDDQVTINQVQDLLQAIRLRLSELGIPAHLDTMTPVRFEQDGVRKELGPDLYVVAGCDVRDRKVWKAWEEGDRYPSLIAEFLSPSTQRNDRGGKMALYATTFRTPEYYLHDPEKLILEAYRLSGQEYARVLPDAAGQVPCDLLQGGLRIDDGCIRLFRRDGTIVPTDAERADAEQKRADAERQRADALAAEVARLRRHL